jgi:Na+:H+ antiporter, NhaA family
MSEEARSVPNQRSARSVIDEFFRLEAAGGLVLVAAAIVALAWANSPWHELYTKLLDVPVSVQVGALTLDKPLLLWINDALMAVFFLLVGLEIKREVLEGEFASVRQAALPCVAAAGGMLGPALVYAAINWGDPVAIHGWAIPAATDIAFALGVLALLGARAPSTLKIFLLALAIIDDLGAIVIIALFYTADLSLLALGLAGAGVAALLVMNLVGVRRLAPYVLVGILLWVCVLKSGVHATLAGVAIGFAVPLRGGTKEEGDSPLRRLEHMLHPWVTYGILPIFAFANAGVPLAGLSLGSLLKPVPLGIALGLFLGKQIGVMGATWAAVRLGIGVRPQGATWLQFYGMAVLTGIGFTMSLFIGTLAFQDPDYNTAVRIGVLAGSLVCGLAGYFVLYLAQRGPQGGTDGRG